MQIKKKKVRQQFHHWKENIESNVRTADSKTSKLLHKKRPPLEQGALHKNPRELRLLCQAQEQSVLFSYKSHSLAAEFYDIVEQKIGSSQVCDQIMMIKNMSNEEAVEEFNKIMTIRNQRTQVDFCTEQQAQQKQAFQDEVGFSIPMLSDEESYLNSLDEYEIISNEHKMEGEKMDYEEVSDHLQLPWQSMCIEHDDIFEF